MSKPTERQLKLTALAVGELSLEEAEELLQTLTPAEAAQLDADRETAAMLSSNIQQALQSALSPSHHEAIELALSNLDRRVAEQPSAKVIAFEPKKWLRPFATVLVSAAALLVAVVVSEVGVNQRGPYESEAPIGVTVTPASPQSASVPNQTSSETDVPVSKSRPPAPKSVGTTARLRTTPTWHEQSKTRVRGPKKRRAQKNQFIGARSFKPMSEVLNSPTGPAAGDSPNIVPTRRRTRRASPPPPPPPPRAVYIRENDFQSVEEHPVTTLAIDVDTAAYSNVRRQIQRGRMPNPKGVRIEEFVNYFTYELPQPEGEHPMAIVADVTDAPWNPKHLLARVALNSRSPLGSGRKPVNIVLLVDVSGSMASRNKLPLLKDALRILTDSFTAKDRVAIVTYADRASVVLPSVSGDRKDLIIDAIDALKTGGSTNGALGLERAYDVANQHRLSDGTNRVVIATDGDFNVGQTSQKEISDMVRRQAGRSIFMTVLGFGDDLKDSFLERLADRSNGHYAMIDTKREANKVLAQQLTSTLEVVAKDVKVQLELNPRRITKYRLIGYENRRLNNADFSDDTVDGGEMGAGHAVTMLYELVPRHSGPTEERVYQPATAPADVDVRDDLLMVNVRYKTPDGRRSQSFRKSVHAWKEHLTASHDTRFVAAVAGFGLLLINSQHKGDLEYDDVIALAKGALGEDPDKWRAEFVDLVRRTRRLKRYAVAPPVTTVTAPPLPRKLSDADILTVLRKNRESISECRRRQLKADPSLEGTMTLRFALRKNGVPTRVHVSPAKFVDTEAGRCVVEAVRTWRFAKFSGPSMPIDFPVRIRGT